jgi:3-methylfumaryl-CoA hydratase
MASSFNWYLLAGQASTKVIAVKKSRQRQTIARTTETALNPASSEPWRQASSVAESLIADAPAAALAATLDHATTPLVGQSLPPLWHWLYFWPIVPQAMIGVDGHPKKGGFLPDLGLPRRMWAGGRLRFHAPIPIGQTVSRTSRILDIQEKDGRSGRLAFVTVLHEFHRDGVLLLEEEQDIVYREPALPGAAPPAPTVAPTDEAWRQRISPSETLLFRYSALTFNSHRIHYDKPYATLEEGYPGLVVHGPLLATLLLDLVGQTLSDAMVKTFSFKAIRPTFLGQDFMICGRPDLDGKTIALWTRSHDSYLSMTAQAGLA